MTLAVLGLLVFAWAVVSGTAERHDLTGPMLFAAAGYFLCNPAWGVLELDVETAPVEALVEVTLALLLFSDAARVNVRELRRDVGLPLRLLGIGLPLSVLAGGAVAAGVIPGLPWALAGFLGAALAPTDAALSIGVINDERLPMRLRRSLNVESGLNDGIATPIVTVMLAVAASQLGAASGDEAYEAGAALRELGLGVLVGAGAGIGGAIAVTWAARRGWIAPGGRRLAALALALGAFVAARAVGGNGFVSAFVAGIAFGAALAPGVAEVAHTVELPELSGEVLALVVWFLFGGALVPIALGDLDLPLALYAALSLTVVRMAPVVLAMTRSGLDRASVAFLAWFGPRGLASVVFALLAIESLGESTETRRAVAAVSLTVLMSVVLHGATASPGARRFLRSEQRATHTPPPRSRAHGFLRNRPRS
ncbi:MAG TPA: cation:proton antiporter [Microthrixaceae bacterium]|nr:cation:proton antiporter [Microthrixaceae bacterium]